MKREALYLCLAFVFTYLLGTLVLPMTEPDEGRYNAIPYEMNKNSDYIVPTLNEVPYLEKPPLHYYLTAMVFKLTDPGHTAARLWPVFFTIMTALALFFFMRKEEGDATAAIGSLFYISSFYCIALSKLNILDMTFGFFVTVTLLCAYRFIEHNDRISLYALWVAAGLGFLTKGLAAIVLPSGAVIVYCIVMRKYWKPLSLLQPLPLLLFAAIVTPWLYAVECRVPGALKFFFIHEHFARFTSPVHQHEAPFYFFLLVIVAGMMPWSVISLLALLKKTAWRGSTMVFFACASAFILVFFSLSSSKLITYLTPMWATLCGMCAIAVARTDRENYRLGFSVAIVCWVFAISTIAYPYYMISKYAIDYNPNISDVVLKFFLLAYAGFIALRTTGMVKSIVPVALSFTIVLTLFAGSYGKINEKQRSSEGIAQAVYQQLDTPDTLARYKVELQGLGMLTFRRVMVIGPAGEMSFGAERLTETERAKWFPTEEQFAERWKGNERIVVVMKRERIDEFKAKFGGDLICSSGRYIALENRPSPAKDIRVRR